jgi:hypothetical protein
MNFEKNAAGILRPAPVRFRMSGHFRLITHSPRYGSRVRAEFDNLILDQGLDRVAQGAWIDYCQVGTGNTAPANGQTGLVSRIAGSNTPGVADALSYVPGGTPYHQLVRNRRFATGVAAGTLAEVGMGWATSGAALFSRALILDSGGSPTTITVLSDETLDVEYTLRIYPPTADVTGTKTISGSDYDYVLRAAGVGTSAWDVSAIASGPIGSSVNTATARVYPGASVLGAITSFPSGASTTATSLSAAAYTPGSYVRTKQFDFGLDVTPSGGVGAMSADLGSGASFSSGCSLQISFDPVLPKTGGNVLTLVMSVAWARL